MIEENHNYDIQNLITYKEKLENFNRKQKIIDLQNAFYNMDIIDLSGIMKKLKFGTRGTFSYEVYNKKINSLNNDELQLLYEEVVKIKQIPTQPITKQKEELTNEEKELEKLIIYEQGEELTDEEIEMLLKGKGLKKQKNKGLKHKGKGLKQKGKGLNETKLKSNEIRMNDKYFIDKNKLDNNIIELRYIKNKHLTKIKTQYISDNLKLVINSIVEKQQFNNEDYKKLNAKEKNLLQAILNMLEINSQIDSNSEFDKEFKILMGEIDAGNNSAELKNKLKQYIIYAMSIGKISKSLGTNMLFQLLI